jgi:hypothetical protein
MSDAKSVVLKAALIFFGVPIAVSLVGTLMMGDRSAVFRAMQRSGPNPPVMALDATSHFAAGERETADAYYIHSHCVRDVKSTDRNYDSFQRQVGDYMTCYVGALADRPNRICEAGAKARLIRYTRFYFEPYDRLIALKSKTLSETEIAMMGISNRLNRSSDPDSIQSGPSLVPDLMVVDHYRTLVQNGALKLSDFGSGPKAVPVSLAPFLSDIKGSRQMCP